MRGRGVRPTPQEVAARLPGDELVPDADVVMDRAFTVGAPPAEVWPWLVQLGKRRAGWYLPGPVERLVPVRRRASRVVEPAWQHLAVGDVVPDYGGRDATFEVAEVEPPHTLVYRSVRGRTHLTWAITTTAVQAGTRVQLRLRLAPVRHVLVARVLGGWFDRVTIVGMAAGLRERLDQRP